MQESFVMNNQHSELTGNRVVADLEVAPNLILVGIKALGEDPEYLELRALATEDEKTAIYNRLNSGREVAGYNISGYDTHLVQLILDGAAPEVVHQVSKNIVTDNSRKAWQIARDFGIPKSTFNELELMNYTPRGRLKQYEGRMGLPIADLPFDPDLPIPDAMLPEVVHYLRHDLCATEALRAAVSPDVEVRRALEVLFDIPGLTKKSAQGTAAEIIVTEYCRDNTDTEVGDIKHAAARFRNCEFEFHVLPWLRAGIAGTAAERIADQIDGTIFKIIDGVRQKPDREWPAAIVLDEDDGLTAGFGLGGLHTKDSGWTISGTSLDVASMYPAIVMHEGCAPRHLDEAAFHRIYGGLIKRRLAAKRAKDKVTANALKLVLNATFGGMNYPYSPLYSPAEFLQITVSGQLALIALVDRSQRGNSNA